MQTDFRFSRIGSDSPAASARRIGAWVSLLACLALVTLTGCINRPSVVRMNDQRPIDRAVVEYPAGYDFTRLIKGLTAPSSMAWVDEGEYAGSLLIAENFGDEPRITAFNLKTNTSTVVYPRTGPLPLSFTSLIVNTFRIYGPIGGMIYHRGKIYVSHRDYDDNGMITAFGFDGSHKTIVADLPAQGDYGMTDLAIDPIYGRLYFGLGAATNSGVVGVDNWQTGWVVKHRSFSDIPHVDLYARGQRFDSRNPRAGFFGGDEKAVTSPFAPFNVSTPSRIRKGSEKPTSAIYSVNADGGDLKVEAHGIRLPRGFAFDNFGNLYFTNNGMELRGTRPVKNDRDVVVRLVPGTNYGFPDGSADLYPIDQSEFQPPDKLIQPSAYGELSFLFDHSSSSKTALPTADERKLLLRAVFPSQSGAAKMALSPSRGPFSEFRGAIVALSGDRAPFSFSGQNLKTAPGRFIALANIDEQQPFKPLIRNTQGVPASAMGRGVDALERPIDVKIVGDQMFVLDYGQMRVENGVEKNANGTGGVFLLVPAGKLPATTKP